MQRNTTASFFVFLFCCFTVSFQAYAAPLPVPQGLDPRFSLYGPVGPAAPEQAAQAFLGISYREDGSVDEKGRYSLFASPEKIFQTPGLNCSGFVLSASRFMLHRNITLAQASKDRLGDSGPGAPKGQDWDFGLDLIVNISEGATRAMLLPGGGSADPASFSGAFRGYDLHDPATWTELRGRMKPGKLYLVSFSKETTRKGYTLMHYHVGFILPLKNGELWLYQTTPEAGKVNRRNLGTPGGLADFLRAFANTGKGKKMIAVLEVALP